MNFTRIQAFIDKEIFLDLSQGLKKQLLLKQYQPFLRKMDWVNHISPGLLAEIVINLKWKIFLPNQKIVAEGDVGTCMYFIAKGFCQVKVNGLYVRNLKEGDFFGEIAMLLQSSRRTATVKSAFYCETYTLDKIVLDQLL